MGINVRPVVRLAIWLVVMALLSGWLFSELRIVNNMAQFMPAAKQDLQLQALMSEMQNGPAATTLMLRISGIEDVQQLAELSVRLKQQLSSHNGTFRDVRNTAQLSDVQAMEPLFAYRYLLSDDQDWSETSLRKMLQQRLSDLRSGAGALPGNILTTDPQLAFMSYLQGLVNTAANGGGPKIESGVWFDQKLQAALMLVSVRGESLDLDVMQAAIADIRQSFSQLVGTSAAKLEIAGPGMMAVASRATIEQVVNQLSVFMTLLLVIVFGVAYRSLRLLILAVIPLLSAITVALVFTQLIFNEVHGIVLAFGITLLGVCLDYPLHLFSHLRADETPFLSLKRIWPTLFLSGFSSVLAYLALLGSGFDGLSQLAAFAASGLTVALLTTRYLLPCLVSVDKIRPRFWTLGIYLSRPQKALLALLLSGFPLLVIIQADKVWETSIDAISPVPASDRLRDGELRHVLNVPEVSHVFLQVADSVEKVLQKSENIHRQLIELQTQGIINSVWSPSRILPSAQRQRLRQSTLPADEQLLTNLEAALKGLAFRGEAFRPWLKAVAASRKLAPLQYRDISSTPLAAVLRQGLFQQGKLWISVVRISGISSNAELDNWLDLHPQVKESHVALRQATEQLLIDYRISTFERFMAVSILLVLIIFLWSRSISRTLWVLLPVSIGVLGGFSVPLLIGNAINVFHLLALLLVLGMGLDYSLFFNRAEGNAVERRSCVHAISISSMTTSAAFLMLAISPVPVMAAMGQTVAAGGFMCFISAWILTASNRNSL